jgi:rare lipoprotein A
MRLGEGQARLGRAATCARVAICLSFAGCAPSDRFGTVDPRYGVSASARVVAVGEQAPKGGGVYRVGAPYTIGGRTYVPAEDAHYSAEGVASWYGQDFHGRLTANGEVFDMNSLSAAHPTLPMPSYARVTNRSNGKSVIVRVNDRGPFHSDRLIDVSVRTAILLDFFGSGLAPVRVEYVGRAPLEGSDDSMLAATLRDANAAPAPAIVQLASIKTTEIVPRPALRNVPLPAARPYSLGESQIHSHYRLPGRATSYAGAAEPDRELRLAPEPTMRNLQAYAAPARGVVMRDNLPMPAWPLLPGQDVADR